MARFGYTLMTEQSGPRQLVDYAVKAEAAGFDFVVSSDHYSPWLTTQGHSAYAWSMLGAVAYATHDVELMTYVTCPTMRYHPAVVAQKAATMQLLSEGRFTLGLGSGENLNEHVVGEGWPAVQMRQDMLVEAIEIIRALHTGDLVTYDGQYFRVDSARIWDCPEGGVPLGVAVSGESSIERFAGLADHLIAVEPQAELIEGWDAVHPEASRKIGQIPISWDPDREAGIARAHEQFRWFAGGWSVNADLPTPAGFAAASQFVRPEDVAESIAAGPDLDELAESVQPFLDAGFTDVAIVQVGDEQQDRFVTEIAEPLLEKLRTL
ncbi:TIGR03557 family F420-dependent LLM class oxidoreductase [Microbacterium sp. zg.Y909]|uniref:TIGR03557 family F420-dependent LLM class oxidoreductase n=1 Tax=Microbacterium sp. zg.Y909 TaxID=2969413 RepID=UPI00214C074A|nr:TIGR03557 family F420-dependent LLM class oxidoreductase [Microbacterium sp. zg.Y909]MCR2826921.1 TIGR03557 family F420-dependent LLM class oxidoreductase [Microbacterium sp. zg.Y909]